MIKRDRERHCPRQPAVAVVLDDHNALGSNGIRKVIKPTERLRHRVSLSSSAAMPGSDTPRLLVSLATFNEAGNLRDLVSEIRHHAPHAHILVIDDNSPDGTGAIADDLKANLDGVEVIHRAGKQGLGTAILTAMRYAINHGYDYYINMDADFSHPPRYIPDLLAGMDRHDVMIGSRYIPGGAVEGEFNFKRKVMSTGINTYARLLLGLRTRDNSGSFRCYRVSNLARIDFDKIRSRGYSFMEEILYWCKLAGCRFGETPITFENRRSGISKINKSEAVKALWILLAVGAGRVISRDRPFPEQSTPAEPART